MPDEIIVKVAGRTPDATGDVAADASFVDKNFVNLENAIQTLAKEGLFEGLITSAGCSVDAMEVDYLAFECVVEGGIYCSLSAGSVAHDVADATHPRIDIICVKPTVHKDGSGDIIGVGEVAITKGTAAANPTVPETPSGYLKVIEVDIAALAETVVLRSWKPMWVKQVMLRATAQDTPDMTVKVNFFRGYVSGNTLLEKDVQNSPSFTAPAANKCSIDILHIDSSGTLAITQGTEVDLPNEPSAPTYPTDKLVICEVYLEAGDTAIYQWQIKDVRPLLNLGVGLKNIVEDTSPQLGGDLDAQTKRIYNIKWLDLKAPTEITIAGGIATITQSFHTVDTEGEIASDDLDTINGGSVGRIAILRAEDNARTVVVKHGTGNIWLKGKADVSLDDLEDGLILVYTAGSKWIDLGVGGNGGATTFLALTDSPGDYTDDGLKYVRVKATEDGLEFATPAGAGDMLKATYDVDEGGVVDAAQDLVIPSQVAGDVLYFDGDNWVRLAKAVGKYLKSGASAVSWAVEDKGVCIVPFESDADVAVGDGKVGFTVPAFMNGYDLIDVVASVHTKGITGTTDVQLRRRRAGSDVDMLSTKITIADEWFASDEVINEANDDILTGDVIYPDVDAVHSGTAPKGLSVVATFRKP